MSLDSLCRWQVQVSVYCAWRIPAHLRCTQCSILLHLMDICFLTCICLWQISHIQTRLFSVVGPGLVSTSPAFVSSSASHPAGPRFHRFDQSLLHHHLCKLPHSLPFFSTSSYMSWKHSKPVVLPINTSQIRIFSTNQIYTKRIQVVMVDL